MLYNTHDDRFQFTPNKPDDCHIMESLRFPPKKSGCEPEVRSARSKANNNGFVKKLSESNTGPYRLISSQKGAAASQQKSKPNGRFINRRKSIDCTYTLSKQSAKLYKLAANEPEDKGTSLPPVVNSTSNLSSKEERAPMSSGRVRSRTLSGQEPLELRSPFNEERTGYKVMAPTRANFSTLKSRRSASVDYTNSQLMNQFKTLEKNERKSSFASSNFSQRNGSFGKQPNSNTNSLKNESTNRPISAARNSFNNLQTAWQQKTVVHVNKRPSIEPSSQSSEDINRPLTERVGTPRAPTYNRLVHNKKTHSVGSTSSIGSTDRISGRLNFSIGRRRASLPNAMLGCQPGLDFNSSPEFCKAVNGLPRDCSSHQEAKNNADVTPLVDKTASSIPPVREPARRDLLQSIQEVTHENSFNLSWKIDSGLRNKEECLTNGTMLPTVEVKEKPDGKLKEEELSNGKLKNENNKSIVNNVEKPVVRLDKQYEVEKQFVPSTNNNHLPNSTFETSHSYQSLSTNLKTDTVRKEPIQVKSSNNDSENKNNRVVVNGSVKNQSRAEDYFRSCGCYSDSEDVIDISNIEEDDEDLCDDDFCKKRIIMWLMNAQTGKDAEQVVRDNTPPPSPEPGTQETAIVVIYQGNETN